MSPGAVISNLLRPIGRAGPLLLFSVLLASLGDAQPQTAPPASDAEGVHPAAQGLGAAYRSTTYGLEHGLPSLHLDDLEYGPSGKLWVAGPGGVFTFDGLRFRRVGPSDLEEEGACAPYIYDLHLDQHGVMWAASAQGTVQRYSAGLWETVDTQGALGWAEILVESSDGALWAGGNGLVRITDGQAEVLCRNDEGPLGYVTSIAQRPRWKSGDGSPEMLIGADNGLFRWTSAEGLTQVDDVPVVGLSFDAEGREWRFSETAVTASGVPEMALAHQSDWQIDAGQLQDGRSFVVLNVMSYFLSIEGEEARCEPVGEAHSISQMLATPGGGIWIASIDFGLRLLEPRRHSTVQVEGLRRDLGFVRKSETGRVLVGTWDAPTLWELDDPREKGSGARSNEGNRIPWIVSGARRVQDASLDPELIDKAPFPPTDGTSRFSVSGNLEWYSSSTREPLSVFGERQSQIARAPDGAVWWYADERIQESKGGSLTGRFFETGDMVFPRIAWSRGELLAFNNGRITSHDPESLTSSLLLELASPSFGALFPHPEGDLWITTDGQGLFRRAADGRVDCWTEEDGLPSDYMGWSGVVEGPTLETHLWVNSNAGAFAVTFESLDAVARGERRFLDCFLTHSAESLGADGAALSSGALVLPTGSGLIAIDTHQPLTRSKPPVVGLGQVYADARPLAPGQELRGPTDLEFEYSAAQFPFRHASCIEFRLDGHDDEWRPSDYDRRPRYTSLEPGSYRFELRARSPGSDFGPTLRSEQIVILPLWYQRVGNWLAIASLAAALGLGAWLIRTRALRRRSEELLTLVNQLTVSEDRYRRLFQATPSAILTCSTNGVLLERNDAAAKLLEFEPTDSVDISSFAETEADVTTFRTHLKLVLNGVNPAPFEMSTRVRGGEYHKCDWYLAPIFDTDANVRGLLNLVVDKDNSLRAAGELERLRRALARTEELERSRIARELHDDFSQRLAAMALGLRITTDQIEERIGSEQRQVLEHAQLGIEELARDVHSLSRQLHPTVLDDLGLVAALRSECKLRSKRTSTKIEFKATGDFTSLPNEVGLAILRVAQEGLQNASRHAEATRLIVHLTESPDGIMLEVEDDGAGFDPEDTNGHTIGLSSMRERMSLVGGTLAIESRAGSGTCINAWVPGQLPDRR